MRIPHAPAAPGVSRAAPAVGVSPGGQLPTPSMGTQGGTAPTPGTARGVEDHGPPAPRGRDPATGGGDPWRHGPDGDTAPRKHRLHPHRYTDCTPTRTRNAHGPHTNACITNTTHAITCCTPTAAHMNMHVQTACQHVHTHSPTARQHTEYDLKLTCTHILHTNAHTRTNTLHVSTHTPIHIAHQNQLMCTECTYKSLVQYGKQAHMACTH